MLSDYVRLPIKVGSVLAQCHILEKSKGLNWNLSLSAASLMPKPMLMKLPFMPRLNSYWRVLMKLCRVLLSDRGWSPTWAPFSTSFSISMASSNLLSSFYVMGAWPMWLHVSIWTVSFIFRHSSEMVAILLTLYCSPSFYSFSRANAC